MHACTNIQWKDTEIFKKQKIITDNLQNHQKVILKNGDYKINIGNLELYTNYTKKKKTTKAHNK